jgi:hypothetical protein
MKEILKSWQVENFQPYRQNTLQGFFNLRIPPGLVIKGLAYHLNNGKSWVAFPATAKPDKNGGILRDRYGKVNFFNTCYFPSREVLDCFQDWAAAQLRQLIEAGGER